MNRQTDLEVNRSVRRILVRHWIDLGRLSIRTYQGRLSIRGSLQRIGGRDEDPTTAIVEAVFAEVKRTQNVQHMTAELENWTNDAGRWIPIERVPLKERAIIAFSQKTAAAGYDLDKELKEDQSSEEDK